MAIPSQTYAVQNSLRVHAVGSINSSCKVFDRQGRAEAAGTFEYVLVSDLRATKSWYFRRFTGRYDRAFGSQDAEQLVVPKHQKNLMPYHYWLHLHPQYTIFDAGMKIIRILEGMGLAIDPLDSDAPDVDWYRKQFQVDTWSVGFCMLLAHKMYHLWMNASPPPEWL